MKRYYIYIITLIIALFPGCTIDNNIIAPDVVNLGDIDVVFSVDGHEVRSIELSSISHNIRVDVTINNDNLYWTPVSNQEWCKIVDEEHRGSGSFTMVINANNDFEAREDAVISFKASSFSTPMMRVTHGGNTFVLDKVYTASTKDANREVITVTTPVGAKWTMKSNDWIEATKGETKTIEGKDVTELIIAWDENSNSSRYGQVSLTREGSEEASAWFTLWQYGTDVNYDEEGCLLMPSKDAAPLELRVPVQTVKDIILPSWIKYNIVDNEDMTVSYMLNFDDNPSDARYVRDAHVVLSMLSDADDVSVSFFKQNYYNLNGLLSARGLMLFAKTWNEGGDVSQWLIDDEATLVSDIDFEDIHEQSWVSIGTEQRPWRGVFNGNGKKIYNLTATQPLFAICKNATIKNLNIDITSSFWASEPMDSELNMASIAGTIVGTTIQDCKNYANLTIAASDDTHQSSYVGGLVCKMDASSIIKTSANLGTITVEQVNSALTLGGLAGYVGEGQISDCTNSGNISFSEDVYIPKKALYVGGIAGNVASVEGKLLSCSNNATIQLDGSDVGATIAVGGIAAVCNGTVKDCTNGAKGSISTAMKANTHRVGGIVGVVGSDEKMLVSGNTNSAKINYSPMTTRGTDDEGRILALGGIVGYIAAANGQIVNNTNNYSVETVSSIRYVYVGGVVGWLSGSVGKFSNNSVGATAVINASGKGRTTSVGGLVGTMNNGASLDLSDDTGVVKCTVKGGNSEGNNYHVGVGGLVGYASEGTSIKNASIWAGTLYVDSSTKSVSNVAGFGGVLGYAAGSMTIENCTTAGNLISNMSTALKGTMSIGGIVGYCTPSSDTPLSVTGCTNNSDLSFGSNASKSNDNPVYMAGIVGCATQGNVIISDCHNKHGFFNRNGNNRVIKYNDQSTVKNASYTGGILGVYGLGTTSGTLSIIDCTNNSTVSQNNADYKEMLRGNRGGLGGIAGYVRSAEICNCTNSGPVVRSCGPVGGIVSIASNTTISACSVTSSVNAEVASGSTPHSAGVAAMLFDECLIENCAFYGDVIKGVSGTSAYYGGISGYTSSETTVKDCKFGGTVNEVVINKDNVSANAVHLTDNVDGNAAVTTPTVRNCTYWNGK